MAQPYIMLHRFERVAGMVQMRNPYRVLAGKPKEKSPLGKPRRR
jgi:hypothetical protein